MLAAVRCTTTESGTFDLCSMVTTTLEPEAVKSIAPPGPLTILPYTLGKVSLTETKEKQEGQNNNSTKIKIKNISHNKYFEVRQIKAN